MLLSFAHYRHDCDIVLCFTAVTTVMLLSFASLQGVIQGDEDLDLLGPEFREAYTRRKIDPFDENAWDQAR